MTRVALYARFSTDKQRETSIEDQLRAARERAERQGWPIVVTYSDGGVSGSVPVAMRTGGKQLLAGMLASRFDVLIVEGLDRLSRDLGEQEQLVKRLEHRGVRIIGTADGYDTEARGRKVMRIARGLVNELYLDDLREKTHRGLAGQFDRGFATSGRSYGYRHERVDGGSRLVIVEAEAEWVLWIFERYAEGRTLRDIVSELNARGVASPRSGTWAVSALLGSQARSIGLLNNELYVGRVMWNRTQWLKDPETGKRRYVQRPREEWMVREDPALRIVPEELWQRVRSRPGPRRGLRQGKGGTPRTLFSGLLRCEQCGAAFTGVNSSRYGCSAHKDRGDAVCANDLTLRRETVDKRLIAELRDELLGVDAQTEVQAAARAWHANCQRENGHDEASTRKRLQALEAEIGRLVDAVATVGISGALAARLKAAEAERTQLERRLASEQATVPAVADVMARWKRKLLQLEKALQSHEDKGATRQILADMLGRVTIGRDPETGEVYAEFDEPAGRLLLTAVGESLGVVAGARFELATFGL